MVGALLKPHPVIPIPDASPFFLRQYIKGHYADMFELYPQLLTEIVLRLPYQIQKHSSIQATFDQVNKFSINYYFLIFFTRRKHFHQTDDNHLKFFNYKN